MSITKSMPAMFAFLFSLAILYYNYSYHFNIRIGFSSKNHYATTPNFLAYKNPIERKKAFAEYITQYVIVDNKFLQKMRTNFIEAHNEFVKTHKLPYRVLFWLNYFYKNTKVLNLYNKSTWQQMLSQTDILPSNQLLKLSQKLGMSPLGFKKIPNTCHYSSVILSDSEPWIRAPECYKIQQILTTTINPKSLVPIKFSSTFSAYDYFIFTANVSPAYRQFRIIRQQWREQHPHARSWQMVNNTQTLNPDRLYNKHYYIVHSKSQLH